MITEIELLRADCDTDFCERILSPHELTPTTEKRQRVTVVNRPTCRVWQYPDDTVRRPNDTVRRIDVTVRRIAEALGPQRTMGSS